MSNFIQVEGHFVELSKIVPETEAGKSVKMQRSESEFSISQIKDEGEISLLTGDELIARFSLNKLQIRQIMALGGCKPQEFIQTLAKLIEVGYYEPLGTWTISIGQFEDKDTIKFVRKEEWKYRNYSTSLVLTLTDGTEIGRATLEFTAPFVRFIDFSIDREEFQ